MTDQHFVYAIPEALDLGRGGAAALRRHHDLLAAQVLGRRTGHPGGRYRTGGLGHLGVKFAAALGAEVTVLSQILSKQEDGL